MAAQDKVTFKQDLTEPVKIRHYEGVVFTGDDCGNLIKVALFDGGVPYSGGGTVSATAVLADGTTFPLTQGSITGNMVSVPLEAGALVVSGLMGLYVKISGGGGICTVLNAIFTVQATDTGRVPTATVTTVNELVAAIRDAQDSIPADLTNLLAAVAPTFSTSTAYSAGAYVWQGGKLYRFTAAHPAGTWTGTDAVAVALGNDVADLKSEIARKDAFTDKKINFILKNYIDLENGIYIDQETIDKAMSTSGTVERKSANNIFTCDPILLDPGTYYVRAPYTSGGKILTWRDDLGRYPVGIEQYRMSSLGSTRVNSDGLNVWEYTFVNEYRRWVTINCRKDSYEKVVMFSDVDFLGSDVYEQNGKTTFINTQIQEDLSNETSKIREDIATISYFSDAKIQFGTISNSMPDENYEVTVNPIHTRALIGPFKLNHSICLQCDSTIKYALYSYYANGSNTSNGYVRWASEAFTQNAQIVGHHPDYEDTVYYYILLAYSDDSLIENLTDIRSKIKVTVEDANNPLGLIACSTFYLQNANPEPSGFTGVAKNQCFAKVMLNTPKKISVSGNVRFEQRVSNTKAQNMTVVDKDPISGLVYLLIESSMVGVSSFHDLYNTIGLAFTDSVADGLLSGKGKNKSYSALNYDSITYELTNVTDSNNRCIIGPFRVYEDIEIHCSENGKFNLLQLFTNNNGSQTRYSQVSSGFMTESIIIPVDPKYADYIYYYLYAAKNDDSVLLTPDAAEQLFEIKRKPGANPLGIVFANSWNADREPIGQNSPQMYRAVFADTLHGNALVYFGFEGATFSWSQEKIESANNVNPAKIPDGKTVYLVRGGTSTNLFKQTRTFEELYSWLNYHVEYFDFKKLTGSIAFNDRLRFTHDAEVRGTAFSESITALNVLAGNDIVFSHVPNINIYNGHAYIMFQASSEAVEFSTTTSIFLADVNLANNTYTITKVVGPGTFGGLTFDGRASNPNGAIVDGKLYSVSQATVNGEIVLVLTTYNISTRSFTNSLCQFVVDDENHDFTVANLNKYIGAKNGIHDYGYEIILSVPVTKDGTTYYSAMSSGSFGNGKTVVLYTTDFLTWNVYRILPMKYGSDCEAVIYIEGNYMYGASRHKYSDATMCIWKLNMNSKKIDDYIQIPDCAMRPTWYKKGDRLYLLHVLANRNSVQMLLIDTSNLSFSRNWLEGVVDAGFGYNSLASNGNDTWIATQISASRVVFAKLPNECFE